MSWATQSDWFYEVSLMIVPSKRRHSFILFRRLLNVLSVTLALKKVDKEARSHGGEDIASCQKAFNSTRLSHCVCLSVNHISGGTSAFYPSDERELREIHVRAGQVGDHRCTWRVFFQRSDSELMLPLHCIAYWRMRNGNEIYLRGSTAVKLQTTTLPIEWIQKYGYSVEDERKRELACQEQ